MFSRAHCRPRAVEDADVQAMVATAQGEPTRRQQKFWPVRDVALLRFLAGTGARAEEVRQWGRYAGDPTPEQPTRYFHLCPTDLDRARRPRTASTQLGYGVQLGTVRFLDTFTTVAGIPRSVIAEVARRLDRLKPSYVTSRVTCSAREKVARY